MQTIIDVLFKNKRDIYGKYASNLSGAVFNDVNFDYATLTGVDFTGTKLAGYSYEDIIEKSWKLTS